MIIGVLLSEFMEPITFTGLAAIIAAVVGPVVGCVLLLIRYQHRDSLETRNLISDVKNENLTMNLETRDMIADTREMIADSEKRTHALIERQGREYNKKLDKLIGSLADTRERLTRIEGRLDIGFHPRDDSQPDDA